MSMENNDELLESARALGASEGDLRERVRDLVTRALVQRRVEPQVIRDVMQATVSGLGDGLRARGALAGAALKDAVAGLDDAVGRSVYALRMALEEARGQGREFTEGDIKATVDAVRELEQDLLETLKHAADRSQDWLRDELHDIRAHLQRTGTDTGAHVRAVLEAFNNRLSAAASGSGLDVRAAAGQTVERLSAVASGILRGLADAIDAKRP